LKDVFLLNHAREGGKSASHLKWKSKLRTDLGEGGIPNLGGEGGGEGKTSIRREEKMETIRAGKEKGGRTSYIASFFPREKKKKRKGEGGEGYFFCL